jgi:hypothetical protein
VRADAGLQSPCLPLPRLQALVERLKSRGVLVFTVAPGVLRLVTHLNVTDADVGVVCGLLRQLAEEGQGGEEKDMEKEREGADAAASVVAAAEDRVAAKADGDGNRTGAATT